jgi:sulfate adenylyltransferase (ADP) / ATP adenylyltransferase
MKRGTLWATVTERTQSALECGALQPIPTDSEFIEQGGIRFLVRVVSNLARKDQAHQQAKQAIAPGKAFNPFLPYEEDLFVANLSETHLCLLNKFNVVEYHLLIVTRAFEDQETLLNLQDFAALWICLSETTGLGFYNSGTAAGASQRHKHLQIVPLPIAPEGASVPIQPLLTLAQWHDGIGKAPGLPFAHAIAQLDLHPDLPATAAAPVILDAYFKLLVSVGLKASEGRAITAYNLLITQQWILIVPRTQERFESISVNALGFAGSLFVRDQEQLQRLKDCRPLTLLSAVAVPVD